MSISGYESWFVSARDPVSARALWIRHTRHRPRQGPESAALWCTVVDPHPGRPATVVKEVFADFPALPRTKLEAVVPDGRLAGTLEIGGRELAVSGWRGTAGHNWGSEHADSWVWLHAADFGAVPEAWLELVLARPPPAVGDHGGCRSS
jgi:hypothetical protein